jgi:hypothetical protein
VHGIETVYHDDSAEMNPRGQFPVVAAAWDDQVVFWNPGQRSGDHDESTYGGPSTA